MEKTKPNFNSEENPGTDRHGSGRNGGHGADRFMKDKRKRIVRTEKNPRSFEPGKAAEGADPEKKRQSFNPNFTDDNRPRGHAVKRDDRRDYPASHDKEGGHYKGSRPSAPYKKQEGGYKKSGGEYRKKEGDDAKYADGNYPKFPRSPQSSEMRLNRYLAMSGISSRREADELIKAGVVSVNGAIVTELGMKVNPGDVVKFNDSVVRGESKVYILMNKPKGYVTSLEDPHADKIVMDLLKNHVSERVYPVGRLDKSSMGVLLITNDGDITKRLTHPTYNKKKIYHVTLDKQVAKADMERITEGITLEDGEIRADEIDYVGESRKEVGIEIHSGRNRIIRRIFDELGYRVVKLDRVYFAGLTKKKLKRGAWRFLSPAEVGILLSGKYE